MRVEISKVQMYSFKNLMIVERGETREDVVSVQNR